MVIKKIPLSRLNNYELHSFGEAVLTVLTPYDLVTLRMDKLTSSLTEAFNNFDSVIMRERRGEYTKPLRDADNIRDNAGTVLIRVVDTQRLRSNPDVKDAAQKVMRVFELHGKDLHKFNRVEQSAALSNIFNDLDTEEYQAYLTLLDAQTFYTELKDAQANFMSVIAEIADTPLKDGLNVKNTRPPLSTILKSRSEPQPFCHTICLIEIIWQMLI
jgi:hypothetical protein